MTGGLSRAGKQPRPPKVCITVSLPIIGTIIWVIIVDGRIVAVVGQPFPWELRIKMIPDHPDIPAGVPLSVEVRTDIVNVAFLLPNKQESQVAVGTDDPGFIVQFRMSQPLDPTIPTYYGYWRSPRYPQP